jgi:hypothetical protein
VHQKSIAWNRAALRVQFTFALLARLYCKGGYDPDQPRDKYGKWQYVGPKKPEKIDLKDLSEIPSQLPASTQLRNQIVKQVVKLIARLAVEAALIDSGIGTAVGVSMLVADAINTAAWLKDYAPVIQSYFDAPKSLDELQQNALTSRSGYDIHHIAEQTPAENAGFPRSMIDAPENLVSVPRFKHQEISDWYSTANEDLDKLTPREYLRDKDWDARTTIGLNALKDVGVLKP